MFVIRCSLFVVRYSLFVVRYSLFVIRCFCSLFLFAEFNYATTFFSRFYIPSENEKFVEFEKRKSDTDQRTTSS